MRSLALARVGLGILLLASSIDAVDPPSSPPIPARVMTFNIRYDNPGDGHDRWAFRKDLVAHVIRWHGAEIIGLQEALGHQVKDLEKSLGMASFGTPRDGDAGGERCTIFYDDERYECSRNETFWLSTTPDQPSKSWGSSLRRITTWESSAR